MDYTGIDLPTSVLNLVELTPYEDIILAILRRGLPDLKIHSLIPPPGQLEFPFVLVHRAQPLENWGGDPRFTDSGRLTVSVFTTDPDGFEKGQLISEAVRITLRKAWLEHWNFPGLGSVIRIQLKSEATRSPDWATSSGPVQFADLPSNTIRHEAAYKMTIRKPRIR